MSRNTVITGHPGDRLGRGRAEPIGCAVRAVGASALIDKDPDLLLELDDLVSPEARGDPMSPLRWTAKSTYNLADALRAKGFEISPRTVGDLLAEMGYSLQGDLQAERGRPARGP